MAGKFKKICEKIKLFRNLPRASRQPVRGKVQFYLLSPQFAQLFTTFVAI
jgi:hypothetical protein